MKKETIGAFTLAFVLALSLSGCSSASADTRMQTAEAPSPPAGPSEAETGAVTLAQRELYHADGIQISVTGMEKAFLGTELSFLISNSTGRNIAVTTRYLSVNGFMMDISTLYTPVAAEKQARDSLTLYQSELDKCGIGAIADIAFYLQIIDSDSYEPLARSELLTLTTSASGSHTQHIQDAGEALFNTGGIRVVSQGLKDDLFWDGALVLYLENESPDPITIYAENVSVNGFMISESLWTDLRPGTRAVDGMLLLDLEGSGLTEIGQIRKLEFTLRIVDANTWTDLVEGQKITLTFP